MFDSPKHKLHNTQTQKKMQLSSKNSDFDVTWFVFSPRTTCREELHILRFFEDTHFFLVFSYTSSQNNNYIKTCTGKTCLAIDVVPRLRICVLSVLSLKTEQITEFVS
jgi:hypothetical protein